MEESKEMQKSLATTSPLDVASIDLDISTDEIVQFVAESRRSTPPLIEKAATGQPIPALSADELAALEVNEDLDGYNQSCQSQERKP
ncbi:MAG: hypothetical protein ACK4SA_16145, partial [Caldilinea sp.]